MFQLFFLSSLYPCRIHYSSTTFGNWLPKFKVINVPAFLLVLPLPLQNTLQQHNLWQLVAQVQSHQCSSFSSCPPLHLLLTLGQVAWSLPQPVASPSTVAQSHALW